MDIPIIIFAITLLIYIPLAGIVLYVWHKHGKGEPMVMLARVIFILGSLALFGYMLTI